MVQLETALGSCHKCNNWCHTLLTGLRGSSALKEKKNKTKHWNKCLHVRQLRRNTDQDGSQNMG
jgi:hypothetical protein